MLNPTGRIKIFLLLSWSKLGKTTYVHIRYNSFNYILIAFFYILPGDLRALPLGKKNQQKQPNKNPLWMLFFFSDSPVIHTPVLLCALCHLNKQFVHCRILKLHETKMQAILGYIQIVKIRAGTSRKRIWRLPLKKHSLYKWANYILCNRCWGGNYKYSSSCYISPDLPTFLFSSAMPG